MMDFTALLEQISVVSPLAFALVALAGLIMGVAPSSLPLLAAAATDEVWLGAVYFLYRAAAYAGWAVPFRDLFG